MCVGCHAFLLPATNDNGRYGSTRHVVAVAFVSGVFRPCLVLLVKLSCLNMVSLAFIQFKSDRVYAVVSVEDILEFMPKHSDDFKKNKVYKVKWPYLKASSSFSEEDYHDANILCLGGMINRLALFQFCFNSISILLCSPYFHHVMLAPVVPRVKGRQEMVKPRESFTIEIKCFKVCNNLAENL